ncbi:MAG: TetR family transcriptional regulator [Actinomycetota bacterium]|nr:TetR family transcriptional regulator [Actinomycetota bacterium]
MADAALTLTRNQAARRARVIEAAVALASEGGYDAVQMRDVASSASVALGTVYRYFSSKDHLLAATLVEWVRDLERRLAARPPRGDTVADRVVDVIGRASRAMDRDPLLSAALVTAVSSPDPAVSACQLEVTRAISATLLVAMDGVDEERRQGVVKVLSHVWFSSLVGWVSGWSNVGSVGDELETAARLLLRE